MTHCKAFLALLITLKMNVANCLFICCIVVYWLKKSTICISVLPPPKDHDNDDGDDYYDDYDYEYLLACWCF